MWNSRASPIILGAAIFFLLLMVILPAMKPLADPAVADPTDRRNSDVSDLIAGKTALAGLTWTLSPPGRHLAAMDKVFAGISPPKKASITATFQFMPSSLQMAMLVRQMTPNRPVYQLRL
jgi:hypothetical protein